MNSSVILTSPLNVMVPIIKVVGNFCNLRCRYCFYNITDQSSSTVMSEILLEKFISEYMKLFSGRLFFIWHGGEPLLAGIDFFHRVIDLQAKNLRKGQVVRNAIQTNATLINNDWASFFKSYNFKVSVSLDGNKESHDRFRVNCGGKGSFEDTLRGTTILRQYGIKPGIIQTLTQDSMSRTRENFSFFANTLCVKSWAVNIYLDLKGVNKAMLNQTIDNEDLVEFLNTYIDLWLEQDDSELRIREIENFISGVRGKKATGCAFNGSCTGYFCLDYNGKVYPCDRFSDDSQFLFGDLSTQPLLDILNGLARLNYAQKVNSLHPDCRACKWQKACHNGCAHHRVDEINGKYYYCEARKAIFSYLKEKIMPNPA